MKRFATLIIFVVLLLLSSASIVFADGGPKGKDSNAKNMKVRSADNGVVYEASQESSIPYVGESLNASTEQPVGSHTVRYSSALWYDSCCNVRHYYGRTEKVSGSGNYKTHIHSALIKGQYPGDEVVWSWLDDTCGEDNQTNATAQSCSSPKQTTTSGQPWRIVTGHRYDVGANGTWDDECAGCIDWVWWTP